MSTTKNFEEIKKDMQTAYAKMNDNEKVTYWAECVYQMYKPKNFPTLAADKLFLEKIQNLMEIKVSDDIQQQVHNVLSGSIKDRQQAVYNLYREKVKEKTNKNETTDNQLIQEHKNTFEKLLNKIVVSRLNENG